MTDVHRVLLASASPRRRELLASLGLDVTVVPSGFEEHDDDRSLAPRALATINALGKRDAVLTATEGLLVIAADTVVDLEGVSLGKPAHPEDARRMLRLLSGRSHLVHTAVASPLPSGELLDFLETTAVTFYPLSPVEIDAYVATGEPMDKAGAYGIQGYAATLVRKIDGDFYTVMGFPLAHFVRTLRDAGLRLLPTNP